MRIFILTILAGIILATTPAMARDQIRVVGSSTVYPFSAAIAEYLSRNPEYTDIVVESTGTGAGIKLFCAGIGGEHPDITNASRRMKDTEFKTCNENGVTSISEVKLGYDGIVLAQSKKAEPINLTLRQIYMALAQKVPQNGKLVANPYTNWSDIDSSLPKIKISVLGPPPSSGTRDSFVEIAMEGGCKTFKELSELKKTDETAFKQACHTLREDGAFVESGENDNLIVQKLESNPKLLGIFGYSFLDQNRDYLRAATIDKTAPSVTAIQSGKYELSRSLYFYVKNAHLASIKGLKEYIAEATSEKTFGDNGYLVSKGLVPLPKTERKQIREQALSAKPLTM
ncbi:MAG: phosphate ABC transporter substrate-binding protein [Alphaproteobacteria bacterium]|nr:MAG: phosphate ABC transporter substrate-binding protein [Alphaproteobacteria bacterium]